MHTFDLFNCFLQHYNTVLKYSDRQGARRKINKEIKNKRARLEMKGYTRPKCNTYSDLVKLNYFHYHLLSNIIFYLPHMIQVFDIQRTYS